MQIHELKGIIPAGFRIADRHYDHSMDFDIQAAESDMGEGKFDFVATCSSNHYKAELILDIPTAGNDCVMITARQGRKEVELMIDREWFINFLKTAINLQDHQHGEP